tara:strand:- start:912 stop:1202 length:291 start_codon:yes stop_codon:yes gene_type:complete
MPKKRASYTKTFKAKVALEALKNQRTSAELSSEFDVHSTQINSWKKHAVSQLPELFSRTPDQDRMQWESERDRLYQQIGKLQVELDWLKKTVGTEK